MTTMTTDNRGLGERRFTPGPWTFEVTCFDRRIPIKGGVTAYGRPYTIAWVNRPDSAWDGQDKANARLIAAAPELFEAAARLLEINDRTAAAMVATSSSLKAAQIANRGAEEFSAALEPLRAAISKALNQEPSQ